MSLHKLIGGSALLLLDNLVVAAGAWIYWLIIAKFASVYEVGQATAVYSLVILIASITQLGLNYPLLKRSHNEGARIVWITVTVQLIIVIVTVPIVVYVLKDLYQPSLEHFTLIALGMLTSFSLAFVFHYAFLGISRAGIVLTVDIIAVAVKFIIGYFLLTMGFGAFGMLLSFLIQDSIVASVGFAIAYKLFGFILVRELKFIVELLKEGIVNMPFILSRALIYTVTVVLLAYFGIATSEIGVFYITLMISVFVGEMISNLAYMVLPVSAMSRTDLTNDSTRISLSFCAVLVTALIVSPKFILGINGTQYQSGETILLILSTGILPLIFVTNLISKLYYQGELRKLSLIGSVRILLLVVSLLLLIPIYGILGAACSVLIANIGSSIPAILWSQKVLIRYLINSGISVAGGWAVGYVLGLIANGIVNEPTKLLVSIVVTATIILILKNTSVGEIMHLLKVMIRG